MNSRRTGCKPLHERQGAAAYYVEFRRLYKRGYRRRAAFAVSSGQREIWIRAAAAARLILRMDLVA